MKDPALIPPTRDVPPEPEQRRREQARRVRRLQARSHLGLWGLALFLLISLGAVQNFSFLPPIPEDVLAFLGSAPPVRLISVALVVYSFSALILILSRMWSGSDAYRGWSHLAYLSAFYIFYWFADALSENFLAVFAAGVTILGLEHYHIWSNCSESIQREKENLSRLDRP